MGVQCVEWHSSAHGCGTPQGGGWGWVGAAGLSLAVAGGCLARDPSRRDAQGNQTIQPRRLALLVGRLTSHHINGLVLSFPQQPGNQANQPYP